MVRTLVAVACLMAAVAAMPLGHDEGAHLGEEVVSPGAPLAPLSAPERPELPRALPWRH